MPDTARGTIETMQQAATILTDSLRSSAQLPAQSTEQHPTKQELKTLCDAVKLEASKIGLMWGNGEPSPDEAQSLFSALAHRHSQLFTLLCRAGYGGGPTLLQSLQSIATPITKACTNLVKYVSCTKVTPREQAAQLTGTVWAACDAASGAGLDNKTAIGRKLLRICRGVRDNIRELKELIAENVSQDTSSHAQAVSSGSDSVDLDFEAESLSPVELENARSSLSIIQSVDGALKLLIGMLVTEGFTSCSDDWESLLFHAKGLADVSNDLAAAMFAPQDTDEVMSAADSLRTGCELIFDELPSSHRTAHAEAIDTLTKQLCAAHRVVIDKLSVGMLSLTV